MQPLVASDKQLLSSALGRLGLTDQAHIAENLGLFHARELARGEYLLPGGERATWAGMLVSGLLREHFVTERGVERTNL